MGVSIKSAQERQLMREAGHMLEEVHDYLAEFIKPGISTKELDRIGEAKIRSLGCIPNFFAFINNAIMNILCLILVHVLESFVRTVVLNLGSFVCKRTLAVFGSVWRRF